MEQTFFVEGMTCNNCVKAVTNALQSQDSIKMAAVDLASKTVRIQVNKALSSQDIQNFLPEKYIVQKTKDSSLQIDANEKSKWKQLQPLFLIFFYLFASAILLNYQQFSWRAFMLDFMGLFFIVFSFFKFLDYKGFPASFTMYDPLAKQFSIYGFIYPFLEVALGLSFLFRFQLILVLAIAILILSITTFGVSKSLWSKSTIKCACLGTALNLPMTEATFIENAIMITMAIIMLINLL